LRLFLNGFPVPVAESARAIRIMLGSLYASLTTPYKYFTTTIVRVRLAGSAQGAQHYTCLCQHYTKPYALRALSLSLPQETHQKRRKYIFIYYLVASETMIGLPVKTLGVNYHRKPKQQKSKKALTKALT